MIVGNGHQSKCLSGIHLGYTTHVNLKTITNESIFLPPLKTDSQTMYKRTKRTIAYTVLGDSKELQFYATLYLKIDTQ